MMRRTCIFGLLGLLLTAGVAPSQGTPPFVLVVNAANPVASVSRDEVSRMFLKKTTKWSSGTKVEPVDQLEKSSLRQEFSRQVHGKEVRAIKSYWQSKLYAGLATPPPELASDEEVLSYLRTHSNAIGYVARGASLGDGVKVLKISA